MPLFTFVCAEHQEYGSTGWRLKSQPDFDPLSGMAVAHDCLEHFSDSANPADEFMALGASMWIRDENYHARAGRFTTDPGKHISADLPDIMRHVAHEGYTLPPAPRTKTLDEHTEHQIDLMFREFMKELREYEPSDRRALTPSADEKRAIRSYLRIGYRRAIKRYKDRQYEAGRLFEKIEAAADRELKGASEGMELYVKVNFQTLDAKIWSDYPEDEY